MTWEPEVEEIKRREELAKQMGGTANVDRQHASGKLTVRERIDRLLDPGSFHEIGALAGQAVYDDGEMVSFIPSNFVMGTGRIEGRRVVVAGDDFTVIRAQLETHLGTLRRTTEWMLRAGVTDPRAVLAGSSPYLRMWGLCVCAWLLAKSALAAAPIGDDSAAEQLVLARFYAQQLLPQVSALESAATAGADDLYAFDAVPVR